MAQWADFPWSDRLYANADEAILTKTVGAVENAYANPAGGYSRFPGLTDFATVPGTRTYLFAWRDGLVASTDAGRTYRISKNGSVEDVTGVPVSGGRRTMFSATEDQIVMAAGGPIITLTRGKTSVLSREAPESTHVAFIDGYLLAIEPYSGRFQYCDPGQYTVWNPLSVLSADGKPDDLVALTVSPYRELLLAGTDSIEQFESLPNGTQPFSRRWATGEGVQFPYTFVSDKTGTYGINVRHEFVRFYGQISQDEGEDVGLFLEKIDDWTDAWADECAIKGQKFIILQAPAASNIYGTKGVTMLLDYRNKRWSFLYGWDNKRQTQTRWPGWSIARAWGKVFAGVPGGIAMFDTDSFTDQGNPMPFLVRSGHVDKFDTSRIDDVEIRLKRGVGSYDKAVAAPLVGIRVNRDNLGFDQWCYEPLGRPGDRDMTIRFGGQGCADTWQFEISVSDPVGVEFVGMKVLVERLGW